MIAPPTSPMATDEVTRGQRVPSVTPHAQAKAATATTHEATRRSSSVVLGG